MLYRFLLISIVFFSVLAAGSAWGRTNDMRQPCANCHTMHNSQAGIAVVAGGAQESLLNDTCYGCHTGTNVGGSRPYVLQVGAPSSLAGGSFYWVASGLDSQGHNIDGVTAQASRTPPGGSELFDSFNPLTCAGTKGCHGDTAFANEIQSISRSHHADDTLPIDGLTVPTSYRFLKGIVGLEDSDWEFTVSSADHNQYKGFARNTDTDPDSTSISSFCARCHGDFHSGGGNAGVSDGIFGNDPWIRHPVDYDMNGLGGEYAGYGGGGNSYNVVTPVGSDNMAAGVKNTVLAVAGDAIIVCVSCHRAHGSPNPSSLRWDYQSWPAGGYYGCGDCHTAKN